MKRILSMLLCLALVIGLVPVIASAAETTASKVTSIAVGDEVIFMNKGGTTALGAYNSSKSYRESITLAASNGTVTLTDSVTILTVEEGSTSNSFAFKDSSGNYLSWSSGNTLSNTTSKSNASSWTVAFDSDGVATIANIGTPDRILQYNASNPRFACYTSNQQKITIYKINEAGGDGGETPTPDPEPDTPAEGGSYKLVTDASTLKAGNQVVIVANDSAVALSTTQNGNNRGQAVVTKNGDTVTFVDDVQILELREGKTTDTFAFYAVNGEDTGYLFAASSSSNYLRTETTLSANSSWAITIDAATGIATIVAQGSNSRNTMQYNSTSSLFACYGSASQKAICIYKLVEETPTVPAFDSASLVLQNNLAVQFNVPVAMFDNTGYSEPYAVFNFDGKDYTVTEKVETTDSEGTAVYAFTFANIAPHKVGETITYTLKSTYNGEEVSSASGTYSILTYCQNKLSAQDSSDKLKTLVSDLLNYCAAVQTSLGETPLDTSAIEGFAPTTDDVTLTSCTDVTKETIVNPVAAWDTATLILKDKVIVRFYFAAESIEGLSVKIGGAKNATITEIKQEGDLYYVDFTGLMANEMRAQITAAVYSGDTAVSETVTYSVESYAARYQNVEVNSMGALVKAMMKYGDSAANY